MLGALPADRRGLVLDPEIGQDCPTCNSRLKVTISDVANHRTVTCPHGHRVKLEDGNGGFRKADKAMSDLDKALRDLGR